VREKKEVLVYCLKNNFTIGVIPGLTKPAPYLIRGNPIFEAGFPLEFIPLKNGAGMTAYGLL
jgi:hypothetical protein